MLQLLQQRTKLAGEIGRIKRRSGAAIYVPQRERELVARLMRTGKGRHLSGRVVAAIYREILSGSRAVQGQGPIGLLKSSAGVVEPSARWCFGACDEFLPQPTWNALVRGLNQGKLSLAVVTGDDLLRNLRSASVRKAFIAKLAVVCELPSVENGKSTLARTVFIITPHGEGVSGKGNRALILIECNSTLNAIKSLLSAMPSYSLAAEHSAKGRRGSVALALLATKRPVDTHHVSAELAKAGIPVSILGIYSSSENYGG